LPDAGTSSFFGPRTSVGLATSWNSTTMVSRLSILSRATARTRKPDSKAGIK
jgi:hypothetical protein